MIKYLKVAVNSIHLSVNINLELVNIFILRNGILAENLARISLTQVVSNSINITMDLTSHMKLMTNKEQ